MAQKVKTKTDFLECKRKTAGRDKVQMPGTSALRKTYLAMVAKDPSLASPVLDRILVRSDVRSISGVATVTVLTKPYACPGKCVYCPTEAIMPKSYLSNEPAAMRALLNKFDPWKQVTSRLRALTDNGHPSDKIELIVKGGTWSAYPWDYRQWFIKRCFDAANAFSVASKKKYASPRTLEASQHLNETAGFRLIGITLETRPDWITSEEIDRLRQLGCTRIELGVQSVNDELLTLTKRGHDVASVVDASRLLKDAGFKTDYHMMPQLPTATPASDLEEMRDIFRNPDFRPDMIKIYPCVVVELAELYEWWKDGKYKPYSDAKLVEMLIAAKQVVPRYCRISRLIRDIPSTSVLAGNAVTNLREIVQAEMKKRGLVCSCLRCREVGRVLKDEPSLRKAKPVIFDDTYEANGGEEHFLSFEDKKRQAVFGFCRLRLPKKSTSLQTNQPTALLRELHTYGHQVEIGTHDAKASQHKGYGRLLMAEAEKIARAAGYEKMSVISGVGVREYYRKLGYRLEGTYMVKRLT